MKTDSIQQMLARYREGTLSDDELGELNRLTHRDEVMASAERRASGIVRRRRAIVFTVAGLLVAGGATWSLLPLHGQQAPMVAEAVTPEVISLPEPVVEEVAPIVVPEVQNVTTKCPTVTRATHTAAVNTVASHPTIDEEPVVICNNQCEADSVINDIWKFLTV